MTDTGTTIEKKRTVFREGREFTLNYTFAATETDHGYKCRIYATLVAKNAAGQETRSSSAIALNLMQPGLGERLFDLVACSEDPVFPVHIKEVILDRLSVAGIVSGETGDSEEAGKWCARRESNAQPLAPEANALSN